MTMIICTLDHVDIQYDNYFPDVITRLQETAVRKGNIAKNSKKCAGILQKHCNAAEHS